MAGFLGGIGSGLKGAFQNEDFINALATMQGTGGDDIFSKIMGGLGKGAGMAQQLKAANAKKGGGALPRPMDNSAVPLAAPPGGPPPGVGEAGIPGAAPMAPPPPPPPPPSESLDDSLMGDMLSPGQGDPMQNYLKRALRMGPTGY